MNRWKLFALFLLGVLIVEALIIWKNWDTIVTAYKNRALIGQAAGVASGVSAVEGLVSSGGAELKNLFG
jgi:hypothetical protein